MVTQFSTWPVHPACCGATHAVASPFFSCAVSSITAPGPIMSSGSHGSHAAARAGSSPRRSCQPHRCDPSSACIRCQPSCPAASAIDQQFAFVPGDSALTYPNATPTLRRCAITRPSTALTCASTLAAHAPTSSMLAHAAVSLSLASTKQAASRPPQMTLVYSGRVPSAVTHRHPHTAVPLAHSS